MGGLDEERFLRCCQLSTVNNALIPELVRDVAPGSPIAPVDSASPANGIRQA